MEFEELKKFIQRSFKDPIAGILLKHSNLTKTQYETLVIDLLSSLISDIEPTYENKSLLRSKNVSRGSFSRTLSQARKNIISSIYTILLLSYIGLFDENSFDNYYQLSEKLKDYLKIVQESNLRDSRSILRTIEKELLEGINELSKPTSLKRV